MSQHHLRETAGSIATHLAAIVVGIVLVMIGLFLSVPIVGLPIGIPVGLAGVLLLVWGFFSRASRAS